MRAAAAAAASFILRDAVQTLHFFLFQIYIYVYILKNEDSLVFLTPEQRHCAHAQSLHSQGVRMDEDGVDESDADFNSKFALLAYTYEATFLESDQQLYVLRRSTQFFYFLFFYRFIERRMKRFSARQAG